MEPPQRFVGNKPTEALNPPKICGGRLSSAVSAIPPSALSHRRRYPTVSAISPSAQVLELAQHYFGYRPAGRHWAADAGGVVRQLWEERQRALEEAQARHQIEFRVFRL